MGVRASTYLGSPTVLWTLRSADMTLTTDQAFTKNFSGTLWVPSAIYANRKTGAFGVTCAGGLYNTASKAGTPIVAAVQSWAALTGALTSVTATIASSIVQNTANMFLSLTTGNTGALTADLFIFGFILD